MNGQQPTTKPKEADEMYCPSCGAVIKKAAVMCVRCGVPVPGVQATATPGIPSPKNKTTALVLAVLFGFWSWLYTYQKDSGKFWGNFVASILTLGIWSIVAWVWAIIDTANKTEEYYLRFPN